MNLTLVLIASILILAQAGPLPEASASADPTFTKVIVHHYQPSSYGYPSHFWKRSAEAEAEAEAEPERSAEDVEPKAEAEAEAEATPEESS
jgi:hypothetical protein